MELAAVPQPPPHLATGAAALTAVYPDVGNPFALPHLAAEGLPALDGDRGNDDGASDPDDAQASPPMLVDVPIQRTPSVDLMLNHAQAAQAG